MLADELKRELLDRIKSTGDVEKIVLFGSEADDTAGRFSDIDVLVILNRNSIPATFQERSANYLHISRAIRDIEKKHPIDLLVYTKPEFEKLQASGSLFIRRVLREGVELS